MTEAQLPDGWIAPELGELVPYGAAERAEPGTIQDDAWILELEDIEKDTSRVLQRRTYADRESRSTKNRFRRGDVLYGKLRPYLNKVVLANADGFCTTEIVPITAPDGVDARFLYYWLRAPEFAEYAASVSHGLNMPRLGTEAGRKAPFVLAPSEEQKRIADKLDALLGRVDACRERLDRVPGILKRYRQSVLAAATSGELTADWREERGLAKAWESRPLGGLCSRVSVGHVGETSKFYTSQEKGVPFIRSQNVRPGRVSAEGGLAYITHEFHSRLRKSQLQAGDLLVVRVGANRGDACVLDDRFGAVNCANIVFARPLGKLSPYLSVYFQSPGCRRQMLARSVGGAQGVINTGVVATIEVALPPAPEQNEIVHRVERLLAYADRLDANYSRAKRQLERLSPALLAKAFNGELVDQDPSDEPASVLLERIRAARAAVALKKMAGGRKTIAQRIHALERDSAQGNTFAAGSG